MSYDLTSLHDIKVRYFKSQWNCCIKVQLTAIQISVQRQTPIPHHLFSYNSRSNANDIALLKMAKPIDFNNAAVGPACLPKEWQNNEGLDQFASALSLPSIEKTTHIE